MNAIAIVGPTTLGAQTLLRIFEEKNYPIEKLYLLGEEDISDQFIFFKEKKHSISSVHRFDFSTVSVVIFFAGNAISEAYVEIARKAGCLVIDNSSAFRFEPGNPLIIPEVNPEAFPKDYQGTLLCNPNCTTIQLLLPLAPIIKTVGIEWVDVATYQSVSGSGQAAIDALKKEMAEFSLVGVTPAKAGVHKALQSSMDSRLRGNDEDKLMYYPLRGNDEDKLMYYPLRGNDEDKLMYYPHPIAANLFPHIDDFMASGYTKEEYKMMIESQKILQNDAFIVNATCVRVPVFYGHSEAVSFRVHEKISLEKLRAIIEKASGVVLLENNGYAMPIDIKGRDEVFVGRLRQHPSDPFMFSFWSVCDNLRKGAALNIFQMIGHYF